MIRIHQIGYSKGLLFRNHSYPLRVFKKDLRDAGFDLHFFHGFDSPKLTECDVLIFHGDNYRKILPIKNKNRKAALDFLVPLFEKFPHVIWFDENDGTGWLRSYIFPHVDSYAKPQLLKDTAYYTERHPTSEYFRDYVVENYHIADPMISKDPISPAETFKLKLSWNLVFKNWNYLDLPYLGNLHEKWAPSKYSIIYSTPNLSSRGKMIPYRVSYWGDAPAVIWWRQNTLEKIKEVLSQNQAYFLNDPQKVSPKQFMQELRDAVVVISPFGHSEICYRDCECFMAGSLLFKPDMNHIQTWPDIYRDGETYISHKWDFSDFSDKLGDILAYPERYEEIAIEGQRRFCRAITDSEAFVRQFQELIRPITLPKQQLSGESGKLC